MSQRHLRWMVFGTLMALIFGLAVQFAGALSTIQVTASPATINPSQGQTTRVAYTVTTLGNYAIYVTSASGQKIRNLASYTNVTPNTRYITWNGKNQLGMVVAAGTYYVVVDGRTLSGTLFAQGRTPVTVTGTTSGGSTSPVTGAFAVTNITPNPFTAGQGYATITYTVPATAYYRIYVRNSSGTTVRGIVTYKGMPAGTYNRAWDGKNNSGQIVPNGTYTVVVEGTAYPSGTPLTTGTRTVNVGTTTTPPTTGAFKVTGITPNPFDAKAGQSTQITYTVPSTADLRVAVRNSAGTEVRALATYTGVASGTRTIAWNGKDNNGAVVADGTYTVTVTGINGSTGLTAGSATVAVKTATTTTPPDGGTTTPPPTSNGQELGMTIEGGGSANFSYFNTKGYKFGMAFKAPKSGTFNQLTIQWKSSSGYGSSTDGTYGKFVFELQTNGAGNFPSGTIIAKTGEITQRQGSGGYSDGAFTIPMTASLTAGQVYHLVMYNTHTSPSTNWSSPNTLMSGVETWDANMIEGPRGEIYENGKWSPWTSRSNMFSTGSNYLNGSHVPMMISWSDGTISGDPYYSAAYSAGAYFYGSNRAGQYITWDKSSISISRIGIFVGKKGTPGGSLVYHLEQTNGTQLATGTIASASQVSANGTWVYATLPSKVTLQQGQTYRLWFESPSSSSNSNCFYQYIPYGESRPAQWMEGSWGGTKSYYISGSGGSWTARTNSDLVFSMQ